MPSTYSHKKPSRFAATPEPAELTDTIRFSLNKVRVNNYVYFQLLYAARNRVIMMMNLPGRNEGNRPLIVI